MSIRSINSEMGKVCRSVTVNLFEIMIYLKEIDKMENDKVRDVLRASNEESNRITRECIQTALVELIAAKPFDRITVTELVKRSGVSRMSFYRNYKTKEDVIDDICADLERLLSESLAGKTAETDAKQWFTCFFGKVGTYEKEVTLLFSENMPQSMSFKLMCSVIDVLMKLSHKEDEYMVYAWVGALTGIVFRWLSGGMKESPEEMAELCLSMTAR